VANIKSAEKRWRQSLKRRMRNRSVRTAARTQVKTVNRAIAAGEPDEAALREAVSALDKAAEKGIIHPNNAARRKSRLMTRFATALTAPAAAATPARASRSRAGGTGRKAGAARSRSTATRTATSARAPRTRSTTSS
jgi:small subunit ribosomal protein S20